VHADLLKNGEMPDLNLEIMDMRKNREAYTVFCDVVLSLVVGKHMWRSKCWNTPMSEIATVSDEAFALLLVENSWEAWNHLAKREKGDVSVIKSLYTLNGAGTRKNHGWTKEGLLRYIALIDSVKKDRVTDENRFDTFYKEDSMKQCDGPRGTKRVYDYGNELLELMPYGAEAR
jgi:hypothetical protein